MDPPLTKAKRRVKFEGHDESWYSQKIFPGGGLNIPGRHVDYRGIICDKDGYVCVATKLVAMHNAINTSLGIGQRYDTCASDNHVQIYTDW